MVNTAIMGRLDSPSYLGAVAVGTLIFNTIYWLFGFLRFTTTGFAAQSSEKSGEDTMWAVARPLVIAVFIGFGLIIFQTPILRGVMSLINPDADVAYFAERYFSLLIWGAPFVLSGYVFAGWLMGMARARQNLCLQIFTNLLNIILVFYFVRRFSVAVRAAAAATLIAQITSCALGAAMTFYYGRFDFLKFSLRELFDASEFIKIMRVNGDVMIRTACLLVMTNMFMSVGASFGTETLAANSILFQSQYFMAYLMDGFANVSSVFAGRALGRNDARLYRQNLRVSMICMIVLVILMTAAYKIWGASFIGVFTTLEGVLKIAVRYSFWLVVYPVSYGFNTVIYGIYNGVTKAAPIRNSSILALVIFLASLRIAVPAYGNDGLWLSFTLFNVTRSGYLIFSVRNSENVLFC
jgi:MATE family multidrug resistance protein